MGKELLYHYTSIETLALILKNKTICFNNLLNVDDLEEAKSGDLGNFGKYLNVSCWTADSEESIPLWNLYTPNMHGVRIGLPEFPFKKYHFEKGQYGLKENVDTYINLEKIYEESKASIVSTMPEICKIEYTNDENKLFPKVRECNDISALKRYIETGEKPSKNLQSKCSFELLGKFKKKNWTFQKEIRYIINCAPTPVKEFKENPTSDQQREFFRRIEDENYPAPYEQIFLELDEKCFEEMEILIGPKASESEKIIVESLINQYCSKYKSAEEIIEESSLRINRNK